MVRDAVQSYPVSPAISLLTANNQGKFAPSELQAHTLLIHKHLKLEWFGENSLNAKQGIPRSEAVNCRCSIRQNYSRTSRSKFSEQQEYASAASVKILAECQKTSCHSLGPSPYWLSPKDNVYPFVT